MNVLIPMAGEGSRFKKAGYTVHKPIIPTIDRRTGRMLPMVVCATMDLPGVSADGANVIYVDRDFHKSGGAEEEILRYYPKAAFITLDHLTEGQASTCLAAKAKINTCEELLIAGCDNGMVMDEEKFRRMREASDVLVFTYRHHEAVLENPEAYGWMKTGDGGRVLGVSVKKRISETPIEDHAVVATFWFRRGRDFVRAAEKMILENDRIHDEFYVDEVIKHTLELSLRVKVFEIERYIGWGTPEDYENYQATMRYWREFIESEFFLAAD